MPIRPFWCRKTSWEPPSKDLESIVKNILSKATKIKMGGKIIIKIDGRKIGVLLFDVPFNELRISRVWRAPNGVKVELEWKGKFAGSLKLRGMNTKAY
jgi:hypothetical protein